MTFRERVRVKPGGVIEVIHPDLPAGKEVEVVVDLDPREATEAESSASRRRPIWEAALEIGASIPDAEWAKVPADLSKNLDHYLCGAPKSEECELAFARMIDRGLADSRAGCTIGHEEMGRRIALWGQDEKSSGAPE